MKPDRSGSKVILKIMMFMIGLSLLVLPIAESKILNKKDKSISELSVVFEPNKDPLIINNSEEESEATIDTALLNQQIYENALNENMSMITFYANMFNVPIDVVLNSLRSASVDQPLIKINNLGFMKDVDGNLIEFENPDLGILSFMENFIDNNTQYNNQYTAYTGNSEYVEALIAYFTKLYPEVDYNIAISIGAAESGYYTAKGMLSVNNIYGGMYNGRLVRHKNIEQGILKYIRLLNNNYFTKGLNTIELIGSVYCPTNINGVKQASPHWLNLVRNAQSKYGEHNINTIEDVITLK